MSKATTEQVMNNGICLSINFSRLGTKRTVRAVGDEEGMTLDYGGDNQLEVNDKKMVHVSKKILTCKELRDIRHRDGETRMWISRIALPSPLFKHGVHLFPISTFDDVNAYLENANKERGKLIEAFIDVYPAKIKEAKAKLKELFNPADYPAASRLKAAFSMTWQVVQVGPDEKLKTINKALFDSMRAKAEKNWATAADQIRDALRAEMAEMINGMADKLTDGEDGKAKRFKETSVKRLGEFLEMFEKRNLTDDKELDKLVLQAKKMLTGVDVKSIRDDDKLRARMAKGFSEIKGKLSGMVEVKPARRVSLADEGEVA